MSDSISAPNDGIKISAGSLSTYQFRPTRELSNKEITEILKLWLGDMRISPSQFDSLSLTLKNQFKRAE